MSNLITAASTAPAHPGYYQPASAMSRILEEASYLARCSDNKTAMRVRPREYAIRYPYMQVNRPGRVSWLVFDLDHTNSLIWEEHGLPPPNFIVRNRNSGNSHLYYAIAPVCTTERAREKPILYMKAVYDSMAALLKADPDYHSGPVARHQVILGGSPPSCTIMSTTWAIWLKNSTWPGRCLCGPKDPTWMQCPTPGIAPCSNVSVSTHTASSMLSELEVTSSRFTLGSLRNVTTTTVFARENVATTCPCHQCAPRLNRLPDGPGPITAEVVTITVV